MNRLWGHFKTITKHKIYVTIGCFRIGLYKQGLLHDLSKYSPVEFLAGVKYYQGFRSPINQEKEEKGYSLGWLHHKGRNKHHFEYWNDLDMKDHVYKSVKMPIKFVKEMFCDRVAASKIYQGENYRNSHPYEYFDMGRSNRLIHEETSDILEKLLLMLRDEGAEATFSYIRNLKDY